MNLSTCPGCTVLAGRKAVTGSFSAVLAVAANGRAVLLSVGPDGSPVGVINVPYGTSFPAPAGGVLVCDQGGRCVVSARQGDGNAILSAFELTSTGAWRDVSGNDGFPSGTPSGLARDVTGDGALDVLVQESGDGLSVWLVFGWNGDKYAVLGCALGAEPPTSTAAVSADLCLS